MLFPSTSSWNFNVHSYLDKTWTACNYICSLKHNVGLIPSHVYTSIIRTTTLERLVKKDRKWSVMCRYRNCIGENLKRKTNLNSKKTKEGHFEVHFIVLTKCIFKWRITVIDLENIQLKSTWNTFSLDLKRMKTSEGKETTGCI